MRTWSVIYSNKRGNNVNLTNLLSISYGAHRLLRDLCIYLFPACHLGHLLSPTLYYVYVLDLSFYLEASVF